LRSDRITQPGFSAVSVLLMLAAAVPGVHAQARVQPTTLISGTLSFDARGTLGDFTGTTANLTGAIAGGPALEAVRGWVEARVDSMTTDNGRRDRDMRKSLGADQYPTIRFDLDELRPSPRQGDIMVVTLVGRFTIHGVTRQETFPGTLTWSSTGIRLEARVGMDVRAYRIGGLSKAFGLLKMQPDIVVHIDLRFEQPPR